MNMEQKFCMKTKSKTSKYDLPWPKGQYCLSSKSQFDQTQNTHNPWVWLASSQAFGLILKNTEYKSANEKQRKLSLSLKKNLVIDSI